MPANWLDWVNEPQSEAEVEAVRSSVVRGRPYGTEAWTQAMVKRLGLESTIRPRGRPRKVPLGGSDVASRKY
jgi:putative transposase